MIKLNSSTVASIVTSVNNNSSVERSDKELFLLAYKEYKSVDKKSRGHITTLLNKEVEIVCNSTSVQNTLKRVFKLAYNYVDMSIVCKFDNLEYTNISNLVKLFKYVDNNEDTLILEKLIVSSDDLRNKVKAVYASDMSPHRYNNDMSKLITGLKDELKLKDTEGEFVYADVFNQVKGNISKMSDEQLSEMATYLESILDERNVIEVEVA